eukprot:1006627_1
MMAVQNKFHITLLQMKYFKSQQIGTDPTFVAYFGSKDGSIYHTKIFNMMHRNLIIFLNPRQYHSIAATQGQISNFEDYAHHSGSQRMMRLNKPKQLDVPSETCCRGHIFYTVLSQTSLSSWIDRIIDPSSIGMFSTSRYIHGH